MRPVAGLLGTLALGALVLAACSSGPSNSGSTTTSSTSSTRTTGKTTTATTTASAAAQNQAATAALKSDLTAAYVAHNGLPADQVAGTAPGSVYYAYLPSTGTYWAIADFVPTSTASQQTMVSMQDEGCCGVFSEPAGGPWTYVSGFLGEPCPGQIPPELETLWGLQYPGSCPSGTTTTTGT
ncbi:MAG TPA: hypothetical protein VND70_03380 [Acidimicrobiales bacterium]|nr:hypothetical protein [Acidimicrobiales bacterium]